MSVREDYEKSQASLKERHGEGSDEDDDGVFVLPTAPEVNPEVYRDVEPLLFRGFLTQPALINGVPFVFKSLNHHEFDLLALMDFGNPGTAKGQKRAYSRLMAFGVLMVDGINLLINRERHIPEVMETFDNLDKAAREEVIFHLSEINRRSSRAVILSEAYAMESISRLRWAQTHGLDLTSPAITGLQGTQALGMNWGQLTWRALNVFEDLRDVAEKDWENAKFAASAMAGKGMSKVHSQDRQRRKKELDERYARKDKILRFAMLGEPLDQAPKNQAMQVARTAEELAAQLKNSLSGEKDLHDRIVDYFNDRKRSEDAAYVEKLQAIQAASDERYGTLALVGQTDFQGLSNEEVTFRIQQRRQLAAQRLAARVEHAALHDPKVAQFNEKWASVTNNPSSDSISQGSDKVRGLSIPKDER